MPIQKLKSFFYKCIRVWRVLKKPNSKEYKTIAKVSALGILLIGFVGFVISLVLKVLRIF